MKVKKNTQFVESEKLILKLRQELKYLKNKGGILEAKSWNKLMNLYKISDPATRFNIVTELIGIGDKQICPLLIDALNNDPSALVRHEAAFGLGRIGKLAHCDALRKAVISDTSELVRHEFASSLGDIADHKSLPTLKRALKDKSEVVVESALYAINKISSNT